MTQIKDVTTTKTTLVGTEYFLGQTAAGGAGSSFKITSQALAQNIFDSVPQYDYTDDADISSIENGSVVTNFGTIKDLLFTLPPAVAGLSYNFVRLSEYKMTVYPAGTDNIREGLPGTPYTIDSRVTTVFGCFVDGTWEIIIGSRDDFIDLRDFGAVGDNVTDDTEAVQRAFSTAAVKYQGSVGTVVVCGGRFLLTDTIALPDTGTTINLNIISDLPYGGSVFEWGGIADTPMFKLSGWKGGEVRNIVCRTRDVNGVIAWDIDTNAVQTSAGALNFQNCTVEFGTGGDCIGWRGGTTTLGSGDISNVNFHNCIAIGQSPGYDDIGWQILRYNAIHWNWYGGGGLFLGTLVTNRGVGGGEHGGGSLSFFGVSDTHSELTFDFHTAGNYVIHGGRYEDGQRFLLTGGGGTTALVHVSMVGVEVGGYLPADEILFSLNGSTLLTIEDCEIHKFFTNALYTAAAISLDNGTANTINSVVLRNCSLQAADPFYTVTGSAGTTTVTIENCLKRAYLTGTPSGTFNTGLEGTWTLAWTASGTAPALGDAVRHTAYTRKGRWVTASFYLSFGASSTYGTGSYYFSLPFIPVQATNVNVGTAWMLDSGTAYFSGTVLPLHDGTARCIIHPYNADKIGQLAPITWAVGDTIIVNLSYQTDT